MSNKPARTIRYRGAKYVLTAAMDRKEKAKLLKSAADDIEAAQEKCLDLLDAGESANAMSEVLDHLYEALKGISDAIPRGR